MSNQKNTFVFNKENEIRAKEILLKYPTDRRQSAIMPLLDLAQRQNENWLSRDIVEYVADYLEMPFNDMHLILSGHFLFILADEKSDLL